MGPTRQSAYILLTLMALSFGGTWVAGKYAVDAVPPMSVAAARFAIASTLLWLWARAKPVAKPLTTSDLPLILGMRLRNGAGLRLLL